jgi:hypothetical protein
MIESEIEICINKGIDPTKEMKKLLKELLIKMKKEEIFPILDITRMIYLSKSQIKNSIENNDEGLLIEVINILKDFKSFKGIGTSVMLIRIFTNLLFDDDGALFILENSELFDKIMVFIEYNMFNMKLFPVFFFLFIKEFIEFD